MTGKVAFFLPTRSGSQRVLDKNTRDFAGIKGGLTKIKLLQLINTKKIDEIILSTNDEESVSIGESLMHSDSRIKIIRRPDSLCQSFTDLQDLIKYVPTITNAKHILWGHVTTPLVDSDDYDSAIEAYFKHLDKGFDSLIGVEKIQNYLYDQQYKLINNSSNLLWPRTQDLDVFYELNHSIFIASRDIYERLGNRHGGKPFFYKMSKLKSLDIDFMEDFLIAEILYKENHLRKS